MARMKLEWQHHQNRRMGVPIREQVLAALPRFAPRLHRAGPLLNALGRSRLKRFGGIATDRPLPQWHPRPWQDREGTASSVGPGLGGRAGPTDRGASAVGQGAEAPSSRTTPGEVALFVDTFTRWFEPENARAALRVLGFGARTVHGVTAGAGERPLCCGRTWLSAGMLDEARREATRLVAALTPLARAGIPIVGLEPSCLYTLRDEIPALLPGGDAEAISALAVLLEEQLGADDRSGASIPFRSLPGSVLVHGHCHQKAFGGADATLSSLGRIPDLEVRSIESGCCGMAGAFGYHAEHYETSMAMGELSLLPAVREAEPSTYIVADGTSCRAQIADGTGRDAVHAAIMLADALPD